MERFPEGPSDDEIAARLRRVREELNAMEGLPELPPDDIPSIPSRPPTPEFDDEFERLQARAKAVSDRRAAEKRVVKKQLQKEAEGNRGLGLGMSAAYAIIGVPLFGIGVGFLIDLKTGTTFFRGLGALLGSIGGIVGAVMMLNRGQNLPK